MRASRGATPVQRLKARRKSRTSPKPICRATYANIRLNISVDKVFKRDDGRWLVTLSGGEQRLYRAVVCATGCNWDANMPEVKGQFNGEIRHSVTYKKAEEFKGKKVMIIGAGNSGADIACDAATHAQKAIISLRRGYHRIPKHLFGLPVDEVSEKGPQLPIWLTHIAFGCCRNAGRKACSAICRHWPSAV